MSETDRSELYLISALVKTEAAFDEMVAFLKTQALEIKKTENLGERALAHVINKHRTLLLVSIFFTADPAVIPALNKALKTEDAVERYLLTDWKGDIDAPRRSERPRRTGDRPERSEREVSRV